MARKSNYISIVQASNRALTVLRVKPSDAGVDVVDFAIERGPWPPEDGSLEDAMKQFALAHHLDNDRVFSIIPRHDATARIVEFPSQDANEIEGMVRLSAEEFVPFPADELVTSFAVLSRNDDGSSKVLAVVVHRDVINAHLALLGSAGLEPEQIFLSTSSLLSAALVQSPSGIDCHALVDLAPGGLEILAVRDGVPEYARGIAISEDWCIGGEQQDSIIREAATEVRGSLSAHRRESYSGVGADHVFISSDAADARAAARALSHELDCECAPAEFGLEGLTGNLDCLAGTLPLVSIGAALAAQGRGKFTVRLLPDQVLKRRASMSSRSQLLRLAAAFALATAAAAGVYGQALYQRGAYIGELEQRADALRPRVKSTASKRKHLERLQQQVERKDSVLELMAGMTGHIPREGMNIQNFIYKRASGITLIGRATQLDMVNKLTDDLRAASSTFPQFARARQMYSNMAKERDKDIWSFNITVEFPDEAGEKPNE